MILILKEKLNNTRNIRDRYRLLGLNKINSIQNIYIRYIDVLSLLF